MTDHVMKKDIIKVKVLSLSHYVGKALERAVYYRDENGVVIGKVPEAPGFFAQGDTFEDARENLKDVSVGLIREIINEVGISRSREEWLRL